MSLLPLPLTIRHVFDFGDDRALVGEDLVRPEAWDALRIRTAGPFALPQDRAAWEEAATANADLVARAGAIDAWLDAQAVSALASYGAGTAQVELLMWRGAPHRALTLTDFGPDTVATLARLFPEATVLRHDLVVDGPLDAPLDMFHRIDTEFSDADWRTILQRFAGRRILVVATEVIGGRRALTEVRTARRNPAVTRAGWLRNRPAFERLWAATHDATPLRMHDLYAWDLQPRA